ncbi:MAG: GDSL-type esterase/lipase family protein [Elusimicrobiota bacterium]
MKSLFLFGDSITSRGNRTEGWGGIIDRKIRDAGLDWQVFNVGIGGNTTTMGLARIESSVLSCKPDIVIIEFGFNDCAHLAADNTKVRVDPVLYETNMNLICEKISAVKGLPFLIINHAAERDWIIMPNGKPYRESVKDYNRIVRKIAKERNLPSCDMEKYFLESGQSLAVLNNPKPDGLHLSLAGEKLYAEGLWPELIKLLK